MSFSLWQTLCIRWLETISHQTNYWPCFEVSVTSLDNDSLWYTLYIRWLETVHIKQIISLVLKMMPWVWTMTLSLYQMVWHQFISSNLYGIHHCFCVFFFFFFVLSKGATYSFKSCELLCYILTIVMLNKLRCHTYF